MPFKRDFFCLKELFELIPLIALNLDGGFTGFEKVRSSGATLRFQLFGHIFQEGLILWPAIHNGDRLPTAAVFL